MKKTYFLLMGALVLCFSSLVLGQQLTRVDQGWSQQNRDEIYTKSEGSELMPLRWFLYLERAQDNQRIYNSLQKYGFVFDAQTDSKLNPYRLPIGVTTNIDERTKKLYGEGQWVGVNCTACHTGLFKANGKSLLIDGAPSLFRIQEFENDIINAVKLTVTNAEKLNRFLSATQTTESQKESVVNNLKWFAYEFAGWVTRNHRYLEKNSVEIQTGPGRVDGLGGPTNDLTCHLSDRMSDPDLEKTHIDPRNCQGAHPAVSLPHLWGMTDLEWVQWDGGVHLSNARNYGQSTGTYAKNWVEKNSLGLSILKSTANLKALQQIEEIYKKLRSPEWNQLVQAGVALPLDENRRARGEILYQRNCISCHAVQPSFSSANSYGNQYWQTPIFSPQEIGVDATYTNRNLSRTAYVQTALKTTYSALISQSDYVNGEQILASKMRGLNIVAMSTAAFLQLKFGEREPGLLDFLNPLNLFKLPSPSDIKEFTSCRSITNTQKKVGFKARSLEGVGLTAPYLHNGSVPTLDDLLKPESERPQRFFIGCNKYDFSKLGYDCTAQDEGVLNFDTRLESNSNAGHVYGTQLTATERAELIEFIKSIRNPVRPTRSSNCY